MVLAANACGVATESTDCSVGDEIKESPRLLGSSCYVADLTEVESSIDSVFLVPTRPDILRADILRGTTALQELE